MDYLLCYTIHPDFLEEVLYFERSALSQPDPTI